MEGLFQIVVIDIVDRFRQNLEPLVIGDFLITHGDWPKDTRLFDKDENRVFFAINISGFRSEDMPSVAPDKADQLYTGYYKGHGAVE